MLPNEVEELANELNYVGEEESSYIGEGDTDVSFSGGAKSFLTENQSNLRFGYKLQNATDTKKVIAIAYGDFPTAGTVTTYSGETVDALLSDGAIIDGTGGADVTATASNSKLTIAHLQRFTRKNPSAIQEIVISSNTDLAWAEKVTIIKANPFFPAETRYLDLQDFLDQYAQNEKKIVIPVAKLFPDFQMDDQTIMLLPIGGTETLATTGVILNVTYKVGGVRNTAASLPAKRSKAIGNAKRLLAVKTAIKK